MTKIKSVKKRDGSIVAFTPQRITNAIYRAAVAVGGRDKGTSEKLGAKVVRTLEAQTSEGETPTVEQIQDIVEKTLIEEGHAKVAKAYILYRAERARLREQREERRSEPSGNIPWAKLWRILDWAVEHNFHTVAHLNERIRKGELSEIVGASEAFYQEDVENAANLVVQRKDELRMVIIAGPSSSGKTTTTIKLGERLARHNMRLVTLNVDNYFFDLEMHPKDEFGDYDFETPQALDLDLINEHLTRLFEGEEIKIPFYDFKTGARHLDQTPMKLAPNDVILIDSLHGLYPDMTRDISAEMKFRLYIEPLLQLKGPDGRYVRWTDIRLIRRMLRDASHRAYDPTKTLLHWHYVRASELRNIIPFLNTTDYIVNSAMPYEMPMYKAKLFDDFARWTEVYKDDPLRADAYERASRVYQLMQSLEPIKDDSIVPENSVIREFIGGSIYEY
ncbi:MAG: ATP cone domain-containing protein [Chloroflexota bacterium]|nr:ATP cone domain-containing protein [Chloroflexota bacterium]